VCFGGFLFAGARNDKRRFNLPSHAGHETEWRLRGEGDTVTAASTRVLTSRCYTHLTANRMRRASGLFGRIAANGDWQSRVFSDLRHSFDALRHIGGARIVNDDTRGGEALDFNAVSADGRPHRATCMARSVSEGVRVRARTGDQFT
jgi:hypothetical protein